jgi:CRP-like cAMP-binding protein
MKPTLTTIEKALFIKDLEFFEHVSIEQAAAVAAQAIELEFEPGAVIFERGDTAEHVYLVIEGNALAERDSVVVTVFGEGRGFGDLSLATNAAYQFTIRAATHLHVLRFSVSDLVETMLEHPEIAVGVVRALGSRIAELGEQLAQLTRHAQDGSGTYPIPEFRE